MEKDREVIIENSFYAGVEEMVAAVEYVVFSAPYPPITLDNFYDVFSNAISNWSSVNILAEIMAEIGYRFDSDVEKYYLLGIVSFRNRLIEANENKEHLFDDPEDDADELIENILSWISSTAKGDFERYKDDEEG